MSSDYNRKRMQHILSGRPLPDKPRYKMKQVSDKMKVKLKEKEKLKQLNEETEEMESLTQRWFRARRPEMSGICQCGCGNKSSKYEEEHFRSSICHIFPQRLFPSVQHHELNWVERAFWAVQKGSACHSNMDNRSMDMWPQMADWDDIKAKFFVLAPLLTERERKKKFFKHLEQLVNDN